MSCPRSYRVATDLPCIPHPCNSARPGLKLPRGINATYWNQIRYKEIRAQRRYPWDDRCVTYTPSVRQCSSELGGSVGYRLAWVKGGSAANVVFAETLLRIVDSRIHKIRWYLVDETTSPISFQDILILTGSDPVVVDLETQKLMNRALVEVEYLNFTSDTFSPVCFAPHNIEFVNFSLEVPE